jgi:hypothetical protein
MLVRKFLMVAVIITFFLVLMLEDVIAMDIKMFSLVVVLVLVRMLLLVKIIMLLDVELVTL